MLREQYEQHVQAAAVSRAAYEQEVAAHAVSLDEAIRACRDARAAKRWLTWLRRRVAVRRLRKHPPSQPASGAWDADVEAKLTAGIEGERDVLQHLASTFGDEWVNLCGYRNRRGEIDQLLLGPNGLFAIEVKHRNGTVYCQGDEWWLEKYDRYGNLVEQGPMHDRRGRSPSVQLNEPVYELEAFLSRRGQPVRITPIVVLTHPRAQLAAAHDPTVNVATDPGYLTALINQAPYTFDQARRAAIEQLIAKDHAFHNQRGDRRRSRKTTEPARHRQRKGS
jgi:hypothetical protein